MAKQIVIDLVGDTKDFQRGMAQAEASTKSFEKATGQVTKQSNDMASSFAQVAGAVDDSESKFMGTADVLDGLATTMGINVGGSIEMARGMADLAGGITQTVVPAIAAGTGKVKAMSAAFLASPHAKLKLGLMAAGAAATYVAYETDNLNGIVDKSKGILQNSVKGWDLMIGKLMGVVGAAASATASLEELQNQGKKLSGPDKLPGPNSGHTIADWMGSEGIDPWERMRLQISRAQAAVAEAEAAAADRKSSASAAESAGNKARAAAEKAAKAVEAALKASFDKVKPRLEAALKKFQDKMAKATDLRNAFKSMFRLDFSDDIGHNVIESVRRQVQKWESFVKKLASLRKMGLRESLVRQFASAGPDALEQMQRINSGNLAEINRLAKKGEGIASDFARAETIRQTGTDPNKPIPVKLTLDVKGDDLKNLIRKWVRTEGGGDVQVAFGKGKK